MQCTTFGRREKTSIPSDISTQDFGSPVKNMWMENDVAGSWILLLERLMFVGHRLSTHVGGSVVCS